MLRKRFLIDNYNPLSFISNCNLLLPVCGIFPFFLQKMQIGLFTLVINNKTNSAIGGYY
jgi:hypothetical protein